MSSIGRVSISPAVTITQPLTSPSTSKTSDTFERTGIASSQAALGAIHQMPMRVNEGDWVTLAGKINVRTMRATTYVLLHLDTPMLIKARDGSMHDTRNVFLIGGDLSRFEDGKKLRLSGRIDVPECVELSGITNLSEGADARQLAF